MQQSFGYILKNRAYRDTSLLLDAFTEDHGRICCVARPAKKRGKIVKGNTEPFRYLHLSWIGKGDVQTLTEADERGRHNIPASELMMGLYLNELLLLLTRQHAPMPELFSAYKYTLHKLGDAEINRKILMRFEIYLLSCLGYPLEVDELVDSSINNNGFYHFTLNDGLVSDTNENLINLSNNSVKILISIELLLALHDIQNMQEFHWQELRVFLDKVFLVLTPRSINSRKYLSF
jgi:DNA repair protein RecO (recombination protein O)